MSTIKFSKWYNWATRNEMPNSYYPGVYAIAVSQHDISQQSFSWEYVKYIGITTSPGGLKQRWSQFNNSIHGRDGHSGAYSIYEHLGNYKKWQKLKLFVAGCPIVCNANKKSRTPSDLLKLGKVAFLEYKALAIFKSKYKIEPRYNKK